MNERRIRKFKLAAACAFAGALVTLAQEGSAQAVTCAQSFNDYAALNAANESLTFLMAPWYNQKCGASYTMTTAESSRGRISNHYHLLYENQCVTCFTSAGEYGLDRACAGTGTGCQTIDNAAYSRFVGSMSPDQMIVTTVSPNPGKFCSTLPNGQQRCVNLLGRLFKVSLIVVKSGPVDIWGTKVYLSNGAPMKLEVGLRNVGQGAYDLTGMGDIDNLIVTGAAGSSNNFTFDHIILST